MEAYVLNLDRRPERWEQIQMRFKGFPIKLHRISAIPHRNGAYGNFQSFLKALRIAKQKKLDSILILEDDCIPRADWLKRWAELKVWLDSNPDMWDIYSGGAWGGNSTLQSLSDFLGMDPEPIGRAGPNTIFKYPFLTLGAHWLYVPKRSYLRMLDIFSKLSILPALDKRLGMDFLNGLFFRAVSSYPFLAYQASSYSNIDKGHVDKQTFIKESESRVRRHLTRRRNRA